MDRKTQSTFKQAVGSKPKESTEEKTRRMMLEMYAKQPPMAKQTETKPSTADNFRELGRGMARSTKRMIDQRKIIADK
jgi:hypothetical protein